MRRVVVLVDGRIAAELAGDDLTEAAITRRVHAGRRSPGVSADGATGQRLLSSVSDRFEVSDWLRCACDDGEPTTVMTVGVDRDVFIEGRGTDFTCAASLQLDAAANVARSLFFRCDRIAPPAPF